MKIYLGSDHNGFPLKGAIKEYLTKSGYDFEDDGDTSLDPDDDFPVFATKVVKAMKSSSDPDPRGILICGSGQGMCMAANRYKAIRAALAYDEESARASRNDDDSNVICIPSRVLSNDKTFNIVRTWLDTPFAEAPRFIRRIKEMDEM